MDDRLQRIYDLLGELVHGEGVEPARDAWYDPPMPPVEVGSNLSATDLLSWWFRPPSPGRQGWDAYFGEEQAHTRETSPSAQRSAESDRSTAPDARSIARTMVTEAILRLPADELASEDAESAVQVFYRFLHAFGEGDISGCLQWIADDYHVIEEDREIDRNTLRGHLEALLESLHGWDYEVTLSTVPEPVLHPYGILIYAEIQIDATRAEDGGRRGIFEPRVVFLERQEDAGWKIAALSRPAALTV